MESAWEVVLHAQSWSSVSRHLLSLSIPQLTPLNSPERRQYVSLLPGRLSMLSLEDQPEFHLSHSVKGRQPMGSTALALNSIGALQRAVNLVLMCPGEINKRWLVSVAF